MKDMIKTASILDKFLKVLYILMKIAIIFMIVGIGIIAAYFLFDLEPAMIGSGFHSVDFGMMTLRVADAYIPELSHVFLLMAGEMAAVIVVCFFCRRLIVCFRGILAPMKEGAPFMGVVSPNLKKAGKNVIILGILVNLTQLYSSIALPLLYRIPELIVSEKITHIGLRFTFDLSFLLLAAVLYLLSYIFRYGEELQQLSDETL